MTWPVIDLKAQVSALNSHALIKYIPGTTMGLDPGFDGGTFELNTGFTVYTRLLDENPVNYYIQCLPPNEYETLVVPVGLKAAAGKEVVLSLTSQGLPMGMKVYLEDRLLAKFVRLDEFGTSYKVTIPASGSETGRFFIHTTQGTLGIDEDIVDKILVIAFPGENRIRIKGIIDPGSRMSIFDLGGRILKSEILQYPNDNEIEFAAGTNGIYIIQVQSQGKTFQQKLNWVR